MSDFLTVSEVAERLRKSHRFVHDELRRKNLRGAHVGGSWRISAADLRTYIDAHMNVPAVKRRSTA